MEREERGNYIYLVIGGRDTGKTSFAKNMLADAPFPKKLIVDTFDNPVWRNMKTYNHPDRVNDKIPIMPHDKLELHRSGTYRMFGPETTILEKLVADHCWNSFVVVEDAYRYFDPKLTKPQKAALLNTKQKNVDIMYIFHFLSSVPRDLVKAANFITLFQTGEGNYDKQKYFQPGFASMFEEIKNSQDPHINFTLRVRV